MELSSSPKISFLSDFSGVTSSLGSNTLSSRVLLSLLLSRSDLEKYEVSSAAKLSSIVSGSSKVTTLAAGLSLDLLVEPLGRPGLLVAIIKIESILKSEAKV